MRKLHEIQTSMYKESFIGTEPHHLFKKKKGILQSAML